MVSEIERSSHYMASIAGNAPASSSWNLGDKTVSVEPPKGPTDLGAFLSGIVLAGAQMDCGFELCPDVAVGEPAHAMLPAHERLE